MRARDLERRPATGVARIAHEPADPVYPGQAGERSGDDSPGDQGQPARGGGTLRLQGWQSRLSSCLDPDIDLSDGGRVGRPTARASVS